MTSNLVQELAASLCEAIEALSKDNWNTEKHNRAMLLLEAAQVDMVPQRVPTSVPSMLRGVTSDSSDPRLTYGTDVESTGQAEVYLVLSDEERAKGFVRPVRRSYVHMTCGAVTTMGLAIAETYARNPKFYGATYCTKCMMHRPLSEFTWDGTDQVVGS